MKRIYWLLCLFSLLSACTIIDEPQSGEDIEDLELDSNIIDLDQAISVYEQYYSLIYHTNTRSCKSVAEIELFMPKKRNGEDLNGYYIVNFGSEDGFAVLSADKRREIVCALSDKGSLHLRDTLENDALSWYLNKYLGKEMYGFTPADGRDTTFHDLLSGTRLEYEYCPPILAGFRSNFHQREPYNKYCFTYDGLQAVVGCGPLAAGTIIGYHEYPSSILGTKFDYAKMNLDKNHDGWSRLFEIIGRRELMYVDYGVKNTGSHISV